jgi:hypothetical protein
MALKAYRKIFKDPSRDPIPERGPAMAALPPKWQACVDALFLTNGDQTKSIAIAGYKGKRESLKVMAHRIFHDDRVRLAIREECAKRIDVSEPELMAQTFSIMRNVGENARDRLNAIAMVWNRANPILHKTKIEVEHVLTDDERDIRHWRALKKLGAPESAFLARFGVNGCARVAMLVEAEEARHREIEAPLVIETEYEAVNE